MYYYILLYGRSLVFHTIFCFVFCFAIDFIVIVLMLRSLMPAVIFAFVIAFIKFICIFMYFFALHIFFRAAVCVYKFVYWKSVFVRLCLFLHVYLLVCQREVVGEPANQRTSEYLRLTNRRAAEGCPVRDALPDRQLLVR